MSSWPNIRLNDQVTLRILEKSRQGDIHGLLRLRHKTAGEVFLGGRRKDWENDLTLHHFYSEPSAHNSPYV